jgi:hypothetical protein
MAQRGPKHGGFEAPAQGLDRAKLSKGEAGTTVERQKQELP